MKVVLGLALIGLGFSAVVEEVPCYRYACRYERTTVAKWAINPVPVWYTNDLTPEQLEVLKLALKHWETISGIQFEPRELPYSSREAIEGDNGLCFFRYEVIKDRVGILYSVLRSDISQNCFSSNENEAGYSAGFSPDWEQAEVFIRHEYGESFFTVVHEIGHAIGLSHPFSWGEPETRSVMQWMANLKVAGSVSDIDVVQYLYGTPQEGAGELTVFRPWEGYIKAGKWGYTHVWCVVGGLSPFSFYSPDCTLRRVQESELCFELYKGETGGNCTVEVYSADGQSKVYSLYTDAPETLVFSAPVENTEPVSDTGGGSGGGCTTGFWEGAWLAGLVLLLRKLRRK
ncbi:MAG: hypothetical protein GXO04_03175 [Aquificae bacterium]|nr:hypothetical protein [Aquificota bacterium]